MFDTMLNYLLSAGFSLSYQQRSYRQGRCPANDHELRKVEEAGNNATSEQEHERSGWNLSCTCGVSILLQTLVRTALTEVRINIEQE